MENVHSAWQAEFAGLRTEFTGFRDTLKAQVNRVEHVESRLLGLESELQRLTEAVRGSAPDQGPAFVGAPAPGG
eukprot:300733-Alexandrium_andersonii.AAC.1